MPSFLKKERKTIQNIKYWNIKGVKNSLVNLYLDGVHFNQEGHINKHIRHILVTTNMIQLMITNYIVHVLYT